jgi:hypothetical protein
MRKFAYKILVLFLLISFTTEISVPVFCKDGTVCLSMNCDESDEKKDGDKKEKEEDVKDKITSSLKLFSLSTIIRDFHLQDDCIKTLGYLSLPEIPPDQV